MFFLLRFPEAEFFTPLIFKRFLSNIWFWARENWSESLRTNSVAVRVNKNPIELKVIFLEKVYLDLYSDKVWGFSIFSFCTPPGDIYGRPLLKGQYRRLTWIIPVEEKRLKCPWKVLSVVNFVALCMLNLVFLNHTQENKGLVHTQCRASVKK